MATDRLTEANEAPLVVIAGPTASGKTALAIKLAQKFNGEIICADSRTIYKGMDIGTAKPSHEERRVVRHWGLDLVEPGERFTAADFKRYALGKIEDIRSRGKVPFLVGGTGLYIDAVVFDFEFTNETGAELRRDLERLSVKELQYYCYNNNIELPRNYQNRRHLISAIIRKNIKLKKKEAPVDNTLVVFITTRNDTLRTRIRFRSEQIISQGVVKEATQLAAKYGWESEAMTGNVYKLIRKYRDGELTIADLIQKNSTSDWQLAKRQMTWFRRNPHALWGDLMSAEHYLINQLANYRRL